MSQTDLQERAGYLGDFVCAAACRGAHAEHVRALSTELQLDQPAYVVVCDQVGGFAHDAGVLRCFAGARWRLPAPGGRSVPEGFTPWLAPVTYPAAREDIDFWSTRPEGLDVRAGAPFASNTEWKVTAGRVDRWCTSYPLPETVDSPPGSTLRIRLDLIPRSGVVTSSTVREYPGAAPLTARQSTFRGTLDPPCPPPAARWSDGPAGGPRTGLVEAALPRVDGTASAGRTAADVAAHLAAALSPSALHEVVRRTLARCR